jgi:hypothetical protein
MSNDFVYNMSEINEEEIMKGWEEIADDEWLDDFQGEEDFA